MVTLLEIFDTLVSGANMICVKSARLVKWLCTAIMRKMLDRNKVAPFVYTGPDPDYEPRSSLSIPSQNLDTEQVELANQQTNEDVMPGQNSLEIKPETSQQDKTQAA